MAKDEARQVMDLVAHPAAEVVIVEHAGAVGLRVKALHNLDQISILHRDMRTIQRDNVLRLNEAIMVLINR